MRETQLKHTLRDSAAEIRDGRLMVKGGGQATLLLTTPRCAPLSKQEPVCRLELRGEHYETSVELTVANVHGLIEALKAIRDGEVWENA